MEITKKEKNVTLTYCPGTFSSATIIEGKADHELVFCENTSGNTWK